MRAAVLVPVKQFAAAKGRLAGAVSGADRIRLAEWTGQRVLAAAAGIDLFVACDDPGVRSWATEHGATVIWGPGLGLNGAIDDGVDQLVDRGYDHVTIAHADLPRPATLLDVARAATITLVPDDRRDGTNVMSFPLSTRVRAAYGAGSFRRHLAAASDIPGASVEVRADPELALDIDTPADLSHPLIIEVLPPWLQTSPANRP